MGAGQGAASRTDLAIKRGNMATRLTRSRSTKRPRTSTVQRLTVPCGRGLPTAALLRLPPSALPSLIHQVIHCQVPGLIMSAWRTACPGASAVGSHATSWHQRTPQGLCRRAPAFCVRFQLPGWAAACSQCGALAAVNVVCAMRGVLLGGLCSTDHRRLHMLCWVCWMCGACASRRWAARQGEQTCRRIPRLAPPPTRPVPISPDPIHIFTLLLAPRRPYTDRPRPPRSPPSRCRFLSCHRAFFSGACARALIGHGLAAGPHA